MSIHSRRTDLFININDRFYIDVELLAQFDYLSFGERFSGYENHICIIANEWDNTSMISFIYFDLGGVVIKDFSASDKWDLMLTDLGISGHQRQAFDVLWQEHAPWLCVDKDVDDLIPLMQSQLGLNLPPHYSMLNDFISHFEPNHSLWSLVASLQLKVKLGLLTNVYPRMFMKIKAAHLLPPIKWDDIIDSSVVKLQKPDPKIFELAQKQAQVPAQDILFIDNTQEHLYAAQTLGWQTFFYDSSNYEKSSHKLNRYIQVNLQVK